MKITAHEICSSVASMLGTSTKKALAMHDALELVAGLEGIGLTRNSQFFAATVGASMHLFDAVYDREPIVRARSSAQTVNAALTGDISYAHIPTQLSTAFRLVDDVATLPARDTLVQLARAQERSILQREAITCAEVKEITRDKGGLAILLLALQINPHLTPEQQACYRQLGYLVQLCDDYVDQEEDTRNGVTTIVHFENKAQNAERIIREASRTKLLFQRHYPAKKLLDLFFRIDQLLLRSKIGIIK